MVRDHAADVVRLEHVGEGGHGWLILGQPPPCQDRGMDRPGDHPRRPQPDPPRHGDVGGGGGGWRCSPSADPPPHGAPPGQPRPAGATPPVWPMPPTTRWSPSHHLVVASAGDTATGGYWLVASDGGVFAFGAPFEGSAGALPLVRPIVGTAPTADARGYWLVASDGGIFAFGDAAFHGSMGGLPSTSPSSAWPPRPDGGGYWLVASDGGIFAFGDAAFHGSMGGQPAQPAHRRHGRHPGRWGLLAGGLRRWRLRLRGRTVPRLHRRSRAPLPRRRHAVGRGGRVPPGGGGRWAVLLRHRLRRLGRRPAPTGGRSRSTRAAPGTGSCRPTDRSMPSAVPRTSAPCTCRPSWARWSPSIPAMTGATAATPASSTGPSTEGASPRRATRWAPRRRRAIPSTPSISTSPSGWRRSSRRAAPPSC